MSERDAGGSSGEPPHDAADTRIRVLVIQSDIAPAEAVLHAFPPERFAPSFAGDALSVMAAATAREIDVVVLDAPLFDVEIDTLLWRLDAEQLSVPVLVLGATPPPQPMKLRFPTHYLAKPVEAARLTAEVEELARSRREKASLPPAGGAAPPADEPQDFLEWSQLTLDLAHEEVPDPGRPRIPSLPGGLPDLPEVPAEDSPGPPRS
jgi:DNA-binding response OmpR family regulator